MMGNRMGQFVIPFLAGLIAAATGVAGIFLIIGASLGHICARSRRCSGARQQ